MNKLQRQQAAWKVQEEMEIKAEQERRAKLAENIDLGLQRINRMDDTNRVIAEWNKVSNIDGLSISEYLRKENESIEHD